MSKEIVNKYKCTRCDREFSKNEYEITEMEDCCILHLEELEERYETSKVHKLYNNAFHEYVNLKQELNKKFNEKKIDFYDIIFLSCLNEEYCSSLEEISFTACRFYKNLHFRLNPKVFYEACYFYIYWNNINGDNLTNHDYHSYIFNNCKFYEKLENTYSENRKTIYNSKLFNECTYEGNIKFSNAIFNDEIFKNCTFKGKKNLDIENSIIEKKFILDNKIKINKLNLKETEFKNKVKIQFCDIDDANFYNTKFKDLADFYQTKFQKVNFERTDFEKISVFSECEFNCDVDFKYTKFLGKSIFRDTVIKGRLDLRNTIFNDDANFLDITSVKRKKSDNQFIGETTAIQVSNRETARAIKNFYDSSNNVIEANKFYSLEMKEREKELDKTKKKNFFEWFVFKIHGITSNHSQDWLLALFWILTIGTIGGFINFYSIEEHLGFWSIFGTLFFSIIIFFCNNLNKWWKLGLFFILYLYKTEDTNFHFVIKVINPFQKVSDIGILDFVFKVIIAYLIYQFIVSIRQNTRRK